MIDYEEVVEAIWRYDIPRIDIDEDVTTLYANGKAFAQVIRRPDGSREDLYFEDYELQKDTLIKPNAKLRDVVELCMNGDISYVDVREWCMENDISLGQFDRWLYGALRKSDTPSRVKPKEPWPYRVVAGLNREGITILMVSHDLQAAEKYARHILRIGEPVFWGTKEEYHAAMGKGGSQDA